MSNVEIYTRPHCPYCARARQLLESRGIAFREIDVQNDSVAEAIMRKWSGRTSVPQIFINEHHVGGCDDLIAADHSGELARLVSDFA